MSATKTWLKAFALAVAALALAGSARAVEADALVPEDAEALISVNVRQLLDSPLVQKYALEQLRTQLKQNNEAAKAFQALGLDPFKDVDSIVLTKGAGGNEKILVVVRGRFDLDKIQKAASDFSEKNPGKLKVSKEKDLQVYEMKGEGNPAYAAFANKNTLIVTPKRETTVKAVSSGEERGTLNKEMKTTLGHVRGTPSVWFAALVTEEMRKGMKNNPQAAGLAPKLESITGSINISDDVKLAVRVHTTDAKAAAQVKQTITQLKPLLALLAQNNEELAPMLNELLDNLKISAEKNTTSVTLDISQQMIEKASKKQ